MEEKAQVYIPIELKTRVDEYAKATGRTKSGATTWLLELGFVAEELLGSGGSVSPDQLRQFLEQRKKGQEGYNIE